MHDDSKKNFFERLQSADERTKKRWLIAVTAIVMVAVVYIWLGYFNGIVSGGARSEIVPPSESVDGSLAFWQTMKNGTAFIYNILSDKLHFLGQILQTPRDFIVKPPN